MYHGNLFAFPHCQCHELPSSMSPYPAVWQRLLCILARVYTFVSFSRSFPFLACALGSTSLSSVRCGGRRSNPRLSRSAIVTLGALTKCVLQSKGTITVNVGSSLALHRYLKTTSGLRLMGSVAFDSSASVASSLVERLTLIRLSLTLRQALSRVCVC